MANSIELFKNYIPILDEVYKRASLTSILDGAAKLARQGVNANELVIQKMTMSGLADYSRNGGYVAGDVNLTNETVSPLSLTISRPYPTITLLSLTIRFFCSTINPLLLTISVLARLSLYFA